MADGGSLDNAQYKRVLQGRGADAVSAIPYVTKGSLAATASQGFGYSGIFMFAVGLGILILGLVFIARQGGNRAGYVSLGDNCTEITCPAGPSGPVGPAGVAGPPGPQGPSGATGAQGVQGNDGLPGPSGPIGQCSNTNPSCLQGATGPTGAMGIPGPTGVAGLPGPTGPAGVIGPQGFTGAIGPTGPAGPTGPQGIQGISGTCDCFSLPQSTIQNLNVTTSLILSGSASCPGGALDANCFGLTGACPNYDTCYLTSLGLNINSSSTSVIPVLQVGMGALDAGKSIVNFGSYPTNYVNGFTVYAKTQFNVATLNTPININAFNDNVVIQSNGGALVNTIIGSSGSVNIQAMSGISIASPTAGVSIGSGSTTLSLDTATGFIETVSSNYSAISTDYTLFKSGGVLPWFQTKSTTSLICAAAGPFVTSASTSMHFPTDTIFDGILLTSAASGLIKASGFELCGTTIKSTGGTLQLQDSTATKVLDIWATITNSESGRGVTFLDTNGGVNFQDTAIHNSNGTAGPLVCDDPEGFSVVDGPLYANFVEAGAALGTVLINTVAAGDVGISATGKTTTVYGNLVVVGSVTAGSIPTTGGGCCTSDIRAKHNITEVAPSDDLAVILAMPRRVAFQYTDAYQKADKTADNNVHHGYIAQELEQILPRTVVRVNQTIDDVTYGDFRRLNLDRIVPHLVGALKQVHAEHVALKEELLFLKSIVKELLLRSK